MLKWRPLQLFMRSHHFVHLIQEHEIVILISVLSYCLATLQCRSVAWFGNRNPCSGREKSVMVHSWFLLLWKDFSFSFLMHISRKIYFLCFILFFLCFVTLLCKQVDVSSVLQGVCRTLWRLQPMDSVMQLSTCFLHTYHQQVFFVLIHMIVL